MDRYQQRYGDHSHFIAKIPEKAATGSGSSHPFTTQAVGAAARSSGSTNNDDTNNPRDREMSPFSVTLVGGGRMSRHVGGGVTNSTTTTARSTSSSSSVSIGSYYGTGSACGRCTNKDSPYYFHDGTNRSCVEWGLSYDKWALRTAHSALKRPFMRNTVSPAFSKASFAVARATEAVGILGQAYFDSLSATQHMLVFFCLLAAASSFLIAHCMDSTQLAAFTVPAVHHGWNLRKKAKACRKAGLYYILIALLAGLFPKLAGLCRSAAGRARRGVRATMIERSGRVRDKRRQYDDTRNDDDADGDGGTTTNTTNNANAGGTRNNNNNSNGISISSSTSSRRWGPGDDTTGEGTASDAGERTAFLRRERGGERDDGCTGSRGGGVDMTGSVGQTGRTVNSERNVSVGFGCSAAAVEAQDTVASAGGGGVIIDFGKGRRGMGDSGVAGAPSAVPFAGAASIGGGGGGGVISNRGSGARGATPNNINIYSANRNLNTSLQPPQLPQNFQFQPQQRTGGGNQQQQREQIYGGGDSLTASTAALAPTGLVVPQFPLPPDGFVVKRVQRM